MPIDTQSPSAVPSAHERMWSIAAEAAEEDEGPQMPSLPQQAASGPQMVGASRAELQAEPSFAGIFSFNKPGG